MGSVCIDLNVRHAFSQLYCIFLVLTNELLDGDEGVALAADETTKTKD